MAMKLWNDDRPLTRRVVLGEQDVATRGMSLRFATEQIDSTTDWCCFDDSRHLVFVHRAGRLRSMETDLDWGPSGQSLPDVGDMWVVPAGDKCRHWSKEAPPNTARSLSRVTCSARRR